MEILASQRFRLGVVVFLVSLTSARFAAAATTTATFGAGCFWCVEAIYERGGGVLDVVSGYAGGTEANPTYEQVGAGRTSHAEVVQITFDPAVISYDKLLELFWKTHDPTDPRGVAPDFGRQYRSILLYHDDVQRQAIERSKAEAQKGFSKPIATEVVRLDRFYPAEEYHQDYVRRNPNDSYVRTVAIPKLEKLGFLPMEKGAKRSSGVVLLLPIAAAVALTAIVLYRRRRSSAS
ncbi:MAG: peptide-methionine (S)-S-oxide reductase MsrA [Verrucomicrobiota bacterium]|nr:peptide-methionine (S)-S-oxide reductase MsrA [Verrucomicrobiota bacterium]